MKTAILTNAYGRKTYNKAATQEIFDNNLDFIINNITDPYIGKPCNKSDLIAAGYTHAEIRYGKNNEKLTIVKL